MKRALTLVEVLIGMALIAALGSLFAFQGKSLIHQAQFERDLTRLCQELRMTHAVARSLQSDVEIALVEEKKGVRLVRVSDEPINERLKNLLVDRPIWFKSLHLEPSEVKVRFCGTGFVVPQTLLKIRSNDSRNDYTIEVSMGSDFVAKKRSLT